MDIMGIEPDQGRQIWVCCQDGGRVELNSICSESIDIRLSHVQLVSK